MAFENITSDDTNGKGVVGLPDTPQLDTTSMQKKFDELATEVIIPKFNKLVDDLNGEKGAGSTGVKVPEGLEADPNLQSVIQALHDDTQTRQPKEEGKGLSTNDYTNEEKEKVKKNTDSRHDHENKSVLDSITDKVKAGYDRIVTLFSGIQAVSGQVEDSESSLPTGKAVANYVKAAEESIQKALTNITDAVDTKQPKENGKGLSTNDYTNEEKEKVAENVKARHTHENKSVLDAITGTVKSGYDNLVTLFSSIKRVTKEIESNDESIPTGQAIVNFVQELGGGDMVSAKYDPDKDGKVSKAEQADNATRFDGQPSGYYKPYLKDGKMYLHGGTGDSIYDDEFFKALIKENMPSMVDSSLKQEGKAADAKATGDAITQVNANLDNLTETLFSELIDGSNTTKIFWKWYRSATAQGETDKYAILCRFADAAALAWNEKTYTLRSYAAAVSGLTTAMPMDDLADKPAAQLCTEKTTPVEDWADEDPMTWYIRANANSLEDGTMEITFFEGEDGFDIHGESAPVYTFSLALWLKEWNDDQYNYISFRTTRGSGFYPDAADVGLDNKKRSLTWHPTFPGTLDSNGALTSGAGGKAYIFASGNQGNQKAKAKNPYEGLWNDCDTRWALRMWQLRHFDLENSGIAEGCTNYNYQYMAAAPEENVKRVLLTASQAANFLIGSTVSVGEMGTNTSKDRYNAWMRNLAHLVHVISIEKVTVGGEEYTAVNLDAETAFTTTATTCISTMPWDSGITEQLPGHKDGCTYSLTAGKTPLRVAGVELLDGTYTVGLDPLYKTTANSDGGYDYEIYECRDSQKLSGSITADYVDTGITYTGMPSGWNYVKEFVRTKLGVLFPKTIKGSSTTYYKSAFYGSYSAGVRCPWRFASLHNGGYAGLAAENGDAAPGSVSWHSRPRLCGSGKKRGEWPE